MYRTIEINRTNLTLMGVQFADLKTLENTANAISSNMFEGFEPTPKGIALIRDYISGKLTFAEFITFAKENGLGTQPKVPAFSHQNLIFHS